MHRRSFLAMAGFLAGSSAVRGQADLPEHSKQPIWRSKSPTHRFEQRRLASADGKRHYLIFIAVPMKAPPAEGWPAMYMLDGNAAFDNLTQADLDGVTERALIGIGYDPERRHDVDARTQDYTPPFPAGDPVDPSDPEPEAGGADVFLSLLAERILPDLTRDFPLDANRRMIWGHSYGGLFVLNVLFKQPNLFRSYFAISPSVRWHAPLILNLEKASPRRSDGRSDFVYLYDVPDEAKLEEGRKVRLEQSRVIAAELTKSLKARPDISMLQRGYPGENHGSMFNVGLKAALKHGIPD